MRAVLRLSGEFGKARVASPRLGRSFRLGSMKFPDDAPVTLPKKVELRERLLRLGVILGNIDEQAVKGTGPGGQKVNKTQSGVLLRYTLGAELIVIKWTRERHHALNRFLALRELCDEVEE